MSMPVKPISKASPWNSIDQSVFEDFNIEEEMRLLTYLSAFLACWLCIFVFPQHETYIRPEVFKVASLMATGRRFNQAVPVLRAK